MKNRIFLVSLAVALALSAGLVGCAAEVVPEYTLTISSTEGGSVTSPGEGTSTYDEDAVVNLVATPHSRYYFVNWTGHISTVADVNAAATTIAVNGDYSITANFGEEEVVTFPDPNLEAAVREAIGRPAGPVYPSDLDGLTKLSALEEDIADLSGLEHCTSLRVVELHDNEISDISAVANLTDLYWFGLGPNQVSDISPLVNLTKLTYLGLESNQISDISPLANLPNLIWLELQDNHISDMSALADLTNLTKLYIYQNPLNSDSINIHIPQLEARGVEVYY